MQYLSSTITAGVVYPTLLRKEEEEKSDESAVLSGDETSTKPMDTRLGTWEGYNLKDWNQKPSYYLVELDANGNGQGTRTVQHIIEESRSSGLEGRVHIRASYSSHIFWLKMGFIPSETTSKFIPQLLVILIKSLKEQTQPRTDELWNVSMHLSDEGRKRWQVAIDENTTFEPFRKYELLRALMNKCQQAELDLILEEQENNAKKLQCSAKDNNFI